MGILGCRGQMRSGFAALLSGLVLLLANGAFAGDANIVLPPIHDAVFDIAGAQVKGDTLMYIGLAVCILGVLFGFWQYTFVKKMPAHRQMLEVAEVIWQTCKTYLVTQMKLLAVLWVLIALVIAVYFGVFADKGLLDVAVILMWSIIGILGSAGVAFFGMRINTLANARTAFVSLRGKPLDTVRTPLMAGMSIGMLLISVELVLMLVILLFVDVEKAGACFLGFAIGESLGASVLRICGGIFTKIADIGSDLMKIVFKIKEDDARNPGVIADCVGDNAGDSVGPTADGFETYGVTGVALITFLALTMTGTLPMTMKADDGVSLVPVAGTMSAQVLGAKLLVWIFSMRIMMVVTSLGSYLVNDMISKSRYASAKKMDFEAPLHFLVVLTSAVCIAMTFLISWLMLGSLPHNLWLWLSLIISCGTVAGALIPVITEVFTSLKSKHVQEIVDSAREGGASLTILSGLVAGNFSAYWMGLAIAGLMGLGYWCALQVPAAMIGGYPAVFAFGLVAFGFLGMGPVTIAVDSYGPVTDNAQSIYELSLVEQVPNIKEEIKRDFGFEPDFESAKDFLEENDGAGNTFKATAKPVLIGTAVTGAATMIFSLVLLLTGGAPAEMAKLAITEANVLIGILLGGAVVYWFTGASIQAVSTGAYRAVEFIKKNIRLEIAEGAKASITDSQKVVEICTRYAQSGMVNIFCAVFFLALGFACIDRYLFVGYLVSVAMFGLYQAVFMANSGGAWDNAKKLVEVVMKAKGTDIHDASVVGDTVGDPFKDTSSVALNPIIKFTTLFGILAAELAVKGAEKSALIVHVAAWAFIIVGSFFVWRSFYGMRIKSQI
jgi:K(+)-stimulated pyrophosphate-energized sodium pump